MVNDMYDDMDIIMSQMVVRIEANVGSVQDSGKEVMDQDEMDEKSDGMDEKGDVMDQEGESDIPVALLEQYYKAMDDILPNKSGNRYIQAFEVFKKWQTSHGTTSFERKC